MSGRKTSKQTTGTTSQSLISKILTANEETEWTKNEIINIMHWLKQIIALVTGVVAGLVPLQGLFGAVLYLACMAVVPIAVCRSVLKIDEEDFGGMQEILVEGAPLASGLFALLWIFFFNVAHV